MSRIFFHHESLHSAGLVLASTRGIAFALAVGMAVFTFCSEVAAQEDAISDAAAVDASVGEEDGIIAPDATGDGDADASGDAAPCVPECADKVCGSDGCGGSCGSCGDGQGCDAGTCVDAVPSDGCAASLIPGCQACSCEVCVCDLDPACCAVAWDATCAALCSSECGQDCGPAGVGCKDHCDQQSPDGCWCDDTCVSTGDCCGDACEACGVCGPPPPGSCEGACGGQSPDGCYCDGSCVSAGDCCDDACALCEVCSEPGEDSCAGSCGGQAPSGCYCDGQCEQFGDCCPDFQEQCEECPDWLTYEGCCVSDGAVQFCEGNTKLGLRCTNGTLCGWNEELDVYDCVEEATTDPAGGHPRTCEELQAVEPEPDAGGEDDAGSDAAMGDSVDAGTGGDVEDSGDGAPVADAEDGQLLDVSDGSGGEDEGSSKGKDSGCRSLPSRGALWPSLLILVVLGAGRARYRSRRLLC